jgi:hypothetical protein
MLCNDDEDLFRRAHTVAEATGESPIYSELKRIVARHEAIAKHLSDRLAALAAEEKREQTE